MRYLPSGSLMQKADAATIQDLKVPSEILMEHAAIKTVESLDQERVDCSYSLIVCGSGNNGGDGMAIARLLSEQGKKVEIFLAGKDASMTEECSRQKEILQAMKVPFVDQIEERGYTAVFDAVFGVGLNRPVSGDYQNVLEMMNALSGRKIAIDIPSGVHAETGAVLGTAFAADLTVTFQCEKLGLVMFPGKEYAGKTIIADIGVHTDCFEGMTDICYTMDLNDLSASLPARKANSHKGTYGKVLMITGSVGMAGAAYLSAKAAYTCGSGLVRIYTPEENRSIIQQLLPEAIVSTYHGYEEDSLKEALDWADVVCIGCGLGRSYEAVQILKTTLRYGDMPCIVDGDGLSLLSEQMDLLKENMRPLILTPHLKEMSRLLSCSVDEIVSDRFSLVRTFTQQYPVVCVLKDARTIISEKGRPTYVNLSGNQSMAKGGSGDVLSGVIAGMLSGGLSPYEAAVYGVYLHGLGGDMAQDQKGSYSVLATDLLTGIGEVLKMAEQRRME